MSVKAFEDETLLDIQKEDLESISSFDPSSISESSIADLPQSLHFKASPHIVQKQTSREVSPTVGSFATSVVTPAVSVTVEPRWCL